MSTDTVSTLCPFTQTWNTKPRLPWHHYSSFVCCLSLCLFFILFPFLHVTLFSHFSFKTWPPLAISSIINSKRQIACVCVSCFISLSDTFLAAFAACTWVYTQSASLARLRPQQPWTCFMRYSHKGALNAAFCCWTVFDLSCECWRTQVNIPWRRSHKLSCSSVT